MKCIGLKFSPASSARRRAFARRVARSFVTRRALARRTSTARFCAFARPRATTLADSGLKCKSTLFHRANVPRPTHSRKTPKETRSSLARSRASSAPPTPRPAKRSRSDMARSDATRATRRRAESKKTCARASSDASATRGRRRDTRR